MLPLVRALLSCTFVVNYQRSLNPDRNLSGFTFNVCVVSHILIATAEQFLILMFFVVPRGMQCVSKKNEYCRKVCLSLWEGARLGSRETNGDICFSSGLPYLIFVDQSFIGGASM